MKVYRQDLVSYPSPLLAAPESQPALPPGKPVDVFELSRHKALLPVPDVRQATDYTCGAASLQAILAYYGVRDDSESVLAQELHTDPQFGTDTSDIVRVARASGLAAEQREGMTLHDLEELVLRRVPVMVAYQAWRDEDATGPWANEWERGHYSVVIGLDAENVYLEDPVLIGEVGFIPRAEFLERWHDVDRNDRRLNQIGIVITSEKPPHALNRASRIG